MVDRCGIDDDVNLTVLEIKKRTLLHQRHLSSAASVHSLGYVGVDMRRNFVTMYCIDFIVDRRWAFR